jgi:hypothetical protein
MKPTVLIVTTSRWFPAARLAMALASAGFTVDAVCPRRHPMSLIRGLRKKHTYHFTAPTYSFLSAMCESRPDLVVACDDAAVSYVHKLYAEQRPRGTDGEKICALLEHSLGPAASFPVVGNRNALAKIAEEEGIRVPAAEVISDSSTLKSWVGRAGLPSVLKADGTSGGEGVRIVGSLEEAEQAFRALQAPPMVARAVKRALIDQDMSLFWPSLLREKYVVSGHTFVQGREATSAIACWNGSVLASLHFEILNRRGQRGASTALRILNNPAMASAAEKIVRRLGLSGFVGFDFMLENETGEPYLIEKNPRATQAGHLALGNGRDLPAAMFGAVTGTQCEARPVVTESDTIALFPYEWLGNPDSPYLKSGYHDVPWEEAEFVRLCVGTRKKKEALYSQREWNATLAPTQAPRR